MKSEFNLIDEPWIKVLKINYGTEEVSLHEVFENAHLFRDLDGEIVTQDAAVMRFLIAILYSVFTRRDIDGNMDEIEDEDEAIERWQSVWELGRFPIRIIDEYLQTYHDHFWLFDEKRPFYQVKEANVGSRMSAAKLNGIISESRNKSNMFSAREGIDKERLTYAEAARWLLHINDFDDTSGKTKEKTGVHLKRGWVGRLGFVEIIGDNLFETLMLNLTMLKDGDTSLWAPIEKNNNCAVWEMDNPQTKQRIEIPMPGNPAALYTLQSRRTFLIKDSGYVIGFDSAGGDFFDDKNAFNEQMTTWKKVVNKNQEWYEPVLISGSKHMWREFSTLMDVSNNTHCPGIIAWVKLLQHNKILKNDRLINVRSISIMHDNTSANKLLDVVCDELSFHTEILATKGKRWMVWIESEISNCNICARIVSELAEKLQKASCYVIPKMKKRSKESGIIISVREKYAEEFYGRIDPIFREWLVGLNPKICTEAYIRELRKKVKQIALQLGREMVDAISNDYIRGRYGIIEDDKGNLNRNYCTAPDAYNRFIYQINQIYGRN